MLALLYNGGNLVTTNVITIGDLSSFLLYALYVGVSMAGKKKQFQTIFLLKIFRFDHFLGISGFYTELMHGVGASGRLFELIERKPSIPLTGTVKAFSIQIFLLKFFFRRKRDRRFERFHRICQHSLCLFV